jgi:diguanylate cyclase (GGDEF)-like protein
MVRWIAKAQSVGAQPVALLLSLDGFDRVNSAYGRIVGDAMLSRVATRINRLVEEMDSGDALVARLTGTEFMVSLRASAGHHDVPIERAGLLARELISEISRPFTAGDHLIRLSGRCGIAVGQLGDDAERLLRRAASALADARRTGGQGGVRVRDADAAGRTMDEDALQDDLRKALDAGQIQILFQPQYMMSNDALVGVEALARWDHPHYGVIGAGALFSLAERSDFLLQLSDHIHARALTMAACWPDALANVRLAINVTAGDIAQPDFVSRFLRLVDDSGFGRERLTVELTESGLVESLEGAAILLGTLREAGLGVAIDDFGTGYSSLAYLKSLPLDYLKIDASLARDIVGSQRDRVIVRAIIDMARSLDLGVIAEGVETEQQLALLARAGVHVYQGFLRSPAVSSEKLTELVLGEQRDARDKRAADMASGGR